MKLPVNLDNLLHARTVEWERLEFKKGWNPESVLRTMCAFANDFHNLGGGYIVIGVAENDGRPVLPPEGLDPSSLDEIQKEILQLGYNAIQPRYHPVVVPEEIDGRHILVLWVPGGQTRPYKARVSLGKGEKERAYFIRKGSSTVRATGPDEAELLSLTATVPFDDRWNQGAEISDLSRRLIINCLVEVESELAEDARTMPLAELGRQMKVVGGADEALFPLNIGLMMFNESPQDFFPGARIDVVWFPDGPGGDIFEEKEFRGQFIA